MDDIIFDEYYPISAEEHRKILKALRDNYSVKMKYLRKKVNKQKPYVTKLLAGFKKRKR